MSEWMPISEAPKGQLIDIWIENSSGGERWADCYYDQICDQWRTSRPSGYLMTIPARCVTHYALPPQPPKETE